MCSQPPFCEPTQVHAGSWMQWMRHWIKLWSSVPMALQSCGLLKQLILWSSLYTWTRHSIGIGFLFVFMVNFNYIFLPPSTNFFTCHSHFPLDCSSISLVVFAFLFVYFGVCVCMWWVLLCGFYFIQDTGLPTFWCFL